MIRRILLTQNLVTFLGQGDLGLCERLMLYTTKWRRLQVEYPRGFGMIHTSPAFKELWAIELRFSQGIVGPLFSESLLSSQSNTREILTL